MSCEIWRDKLDAYVDSACLPEDLVALEAHLRECSACAAETLGRVQMKRKTQAAAARYVPSRDFRLRLEKSIQTTRRPRWAFARFPELRFCCNRACVPCRRQCIVDTPFGARASSG